MIKNSSSGKALYEGIVQKLALGWMFAAPIYFSLEEASKIIDIAGQFVKDLEIKNNDPLLNDSSLSFLLEQNNYLSSPNFGNPINTFLLSKVLSSGTQKQIISKNKVVNLENKFINDFNNSVSSIPNAGTYNLDKSSKVYNDIFYGNDLTLNDFFSQGGSSNLKRKFACQLCVPSNSKNMSSKSNQTFNQYFISLGTSAGSCDSSVSIKNCYGENKEKQANPYWSDAGLANVNDSVIDSSSIKISFGDLLALLDAAYVDKQLGYSFNNAPTLFEKFVDNPNANSNSSSVNTDSINYLQNQFLNYINAKYSQLQNIVDKVSGGSSVPSDPAFDKITGIFTGSKISDLINSANFKIGDISVGMDISMGVIGGFAALLAQGIIGTSTDNLLSQIKEVPAFPLLAISQRGADVTAQIELIVTDLIPGFAIIQGFTTIVSSIAGTNASGNLWENLTSIAGMFAELLIYYGLNQAGVKFGTIIQFQFYIMMVVIAIVAPIYMMALTMFYLPVIPIIIFFYAVLAWFMTVIEAVVAAPILAVGIMHPQGQDEIFGKSEVGLMMLINAMLRPMLIIIGFVSAFIVFRISFVFYNIFFGIMLQFLPIESIGTYITFIGTYVGGMIPLVTRVYGLTNQIPENVMTWIGGTHAGARGDAQEALQGSRQGAQSAPGEISGIGKSAAGGAMMGMQAMNLMGGSKKEDDEPK